MIAGATLNRRLPDKASGGAFSLNKRAAFKTKDRGGDAKPTQNNQNAGKRSKRTPYTVLISSQAHSLYLMMCATCVPWPRAAGACGGARPISIGHASSPIISRAAAVLRHRRVVLRDRDNFRQSGVIASRRHHTPVLLFKQGAARTSPIDPVVLHLECALNHKTAS